MSEKAPTPEDWVLALGGLGDTWFLLKHVPDLLAEVERLRARVAELEERTKWCPKCIEKGEVGEVDSDGALCDFHGG